jgi:hypothetical protein
MKTPFNRWTFISVLLLVLSPASHSLNNTLSEAYTEVYGSFLGGELELSCGSLILKIEKTLFLSPKLFYKSGLDWYKLTTVEFKPAGFKFEGLGYSNGVPKEKLKIEITIPLFGAYKYKGVTSKTIDYFEKTDRKEFVPYKYSVDIYSKLMSSYNLRPVNTYLKLNGNKYTKVYAKVKDDISNGMLSMSGFEVDIYERMLVDAKKEKKVAEKNHSYFDKGSVRQYEKLLKSATEKNEKYKIGLAKLKHAQSIRTQQIMNTLNRFSDPILAVTKKFENENVTYCELL